MAQIEVAARKRGKTTADTKAVEKFKSGLHGKLLQPGDNGYDKARQIWNAMIDRRPAMIAQCADVDDVQRSVTFAREHDVLLALRGGGHNIAGNAVCDAGLVIDLTPMNSVTIDAGKRRATVGPGATLGDFDRAAQAHDLATPLGINSTTGVAGLTLGGGYGWLGRKFGLTIDNLVEAEVVTADSKRLMANEKENADLFWALRGGGGNFGVVTRFDFKLHPVGPNVLAGLVIYPFEQATTVLKKYREYVATAPDELTVWVVLRQAPPLPFLPETVHGKEVVVLAVCYCGDEATGQKVVEPLRTFGTPHGTMIGWQPYVGWQTAFDPLLTPGARNYWKTHNFTEFNDGAMNAMLEATTRLPTNQCEVFVGHLGGQANRHPVDATAYAHRTTNFVMNVHARWDTPAEDNKCIAWSRGLFKATTPYANGGAYINFMTEEESDRVKAAYGPNYDRIVKVKQKYDPNNLFCMNQNIRPAG